MMLILQKNMQFIRGYGKIIRKIRVYSATLSLNLSSVVPSLAGPKRPQDKITLSNVSSSFAKSLSEEFNKENPSNVSSVKNSDFELDHGHVAIAAITSCTNTSNPSVMIGAGILAKKAFQLGLKSKPWVKTSLAPGSKVVTDYLRKSGLQYYLDKLGFQLVGFGCTTCIGNSGPLDLDIVDTIEKNNLIISSVLSGNRNFEGRINPHIKANYLASPPLVVAYALCGSTKIDLTKEPLGEGKNGKKIYLKDVSSNREIQQQLIKQLIQNYLIRDIKMFLLAIVNGSLSKHQKGLLITGIKLQPMFNTHLSFKTSQIVERDLQH